MTLLFKFCVNLSCNVARVFLRQRQKIIRARFLLGKELLGKKKKKKSVERADARRAMKLKLGQTALKQHVDDAILNGRGRGREGHVG